MSKSKPNRRDGVVEYRAADGTTIYSIRFRDATSRQVQEKLGSSADGWTRAKAANVCKERRVDVRREGFRHSVSGPTLAEYIERFLDLHPTTRGLKPSSIEHYRVSFRRILPALGARTLTELEQRPELIERYVTSEIRRGRSPKTVSNTVVAVSTLFKRAQRERLIRTNPCDLIDRPRIEQPPIIPLDACEVAGLLSTLAAMEGETDKSDALWYATARHMVTLALSTGMRRGELLALRWQDVDMLAGIVRVERAFVRGKITTPKTRHSRRTLELGPTAQAAIEEHYAASVFTDDADLIFGHPRLGTPLDPARLGRDFLKPAIAKAGIRETFRPWHDLRHTALTFSASVNPGYVVKAIAGHGSSQVTDRYVSLATALYAGAASKAEARIFEEISAVVRAGNVQEPELSDEPSNEKSRA